MNSPDVSATMMLLLLPEVLLTGGLLVIILLEVFLTRLRRSWGHGLAPIAFFVYLAAIVSLVGGAFMSNATGGSVPSILNGEVRSDGLAFYFRFLLLVVGAIVSLILYGNPELKGIPSFEMHLLVMGTVLGGMLMSLSSGMIMLYVSVEFVSILAYILTGLKVRDPRAAEGAIKYIVFGGVASAVMLLGLSYLYGLTGSLSLDALHVFVQTNSSRMQGLVFLAALAFVFAGLGYKVAVVPFHAWAPDVYQAVPAPITAFFTLAPKIAGFALILRFAGSVYGIDGIQGGRFFGAVAGGIGVLTMTVGNLSALKQSSVKRLLAWSSIAHAGYIIAALAAYSELAFRSMGFYLMAYVLMNTGAFLVLMVVASEGGNDDLRSFAGLSRRGRTGAFWAASMTIFLFSLTGLPPFVGFIGKYYLFAALLEREHYWIALVGVINTVVSLYYYARILHTIYFIEPVDPSPKGLFYPVHYTVLASLLAVATLALGIFPDVVAIPFR